MHCSLTKLELANFTFKVEYGDQLFDVYVKLRPYFHEFLERVSKLFEVKKKQICISNILL